MDIHNRICVVAAYSNGYIGCYTFKSSDHYADFSHNTGRSCKGNCFPQYRYAGTSLVSCYCMNTLNGLQEKIDCTASCPGRNIETCGWLLSMTVYDAQKTTTTHSSTTTSSTNSAMIKSSTRQSVTSTVNSPSVNTKPTAIDQDVTTDDSTANSTTSTILENMSLTGCVLICVAVAGGLVVINIVVLCVCKKNRRSKLRHKAQIDNYGYISPVNITELDDTTTHVNTLQLRNEVTTNSAGTSSNMYEDLSSKAAESHYTDLVKIT